MLGFAVLFVISLKWRKFDDINIVNIKYKYRKYDRWKPMPSGLNGPVTICF